MPLFQPANKKQVLCTLVSTVHIFCHTVNLSWLWVKTFSFQGSPIQCRLHTKPDKVNVSLQSKDTYILKSQKKKCFFLKTTSFRSSFLGWVLFSPIRIWRKLQQSLKSLKKWCLANFTGVFKSLLPLLLFWKEIWSAVRDSHFSCLNAKRKTLNVSSNHERID